jgi:hypothetical protein
MNKKAKGSNELTGIPYVGPAIAAYLSNIGINRVEDLKGKNPQELYEQICAYEGMQMDRCLLYVCRSAVYYAETPSPEPEKVKWWNWKDKTANR